MMNTKQFIEEMNTQNKIEIGSEAFELMHELSQEALKLTMELNNKYHTPEEIVEIFSQITGKNIDKTFRMFPPFYTDCGKNITVGKNVFINCCCKFQDQGGITIGNGVFIGHNVVIATLNHDINPNNRPAMTPKKVQIEDNVWIGSNVTILPGVTIHAGSIIGAGCVVTKDIPANHIAVGNPCKVLRKIEEKK